MRVLNKEETKAVSGGFFGLLCGLFRLPALIFGGCNTGNNGGGHGGHGGHGGRGGRGC